MDNICKQKKELDHGYLGIQAVDGCRMMLPVHLMEEHHTIITEAALAIAQMGRPEVPQKAWMLKIFFPHWKQVKGAVWICVLPSWHFFSHTDRPGCSSGLISLSGCMLLSFSLLHETGRCRRPRRGPPSA
jgi:hypothetical protein